MGQTVLDVSREEGVRDLPLAVRAKFSKALISEREAGYTTVVAMELLNEAIALEAKEASK